MAVSTAPLYVPAPNPTNITRYGLFDVATGPLDMPIHARTGGLQYEVSVCQLPLGYASNCSNEASKSFPGTVNTITANPFVVYSTIECSPVGLMNGGEERVRQFLYQQLVAGEQATVEKIISLQSFDQSPGLANNASTVNLGTAAGITAGIGILEEWLYARYGLPGVLHIPMRAAAYMSRYKQARQHTQGDIYETVVGTKVNFGNYANTNVTGGAMAAGHAFIYITGQVAIWRTPDADLFMPPVGQILKRANNLIDIVMEREYIVSFDCFSAGVDVDLTAG